MAWSRTQTVSHYRSSPSRKINRSWSQPDKNLANHPNWFNFLEQIDPRFAKKDLRISRINKNNQRNQVKERKPKRFLNSKKNHNPNRIRPKINLPPETNPLTKLQPLILIPLIPLIPQLLIPHNNKKLQHKRIKIHRPINKTINISRLNWQASLTWNFDPIN